MNTLNVWFTSGKRGATALCFAGFYLISLGAVLGMIEGTQMLLGLI
jgi:hypothetical protein